MPKHHDRHHLLLCVFKFLLNIDVLCANWRLFWFIIWKMHGHTVCFLWMGKPDNDAGNHALMERYDWLAIASEGMWPPTHEDGVTSSPVWSMMWRFVFHQAVQELYWCFLIIKWCIVFFGWSTLVERRQVQYIKYYVYMSIHINTRYLDYKIQAYRIDHFKLYYNNKHFARQMS